MIANGIPVRPAPPDDHLSRPVQTRDANPPRRRLTDGRDAKPETMKPEAEDPFDEAIDEAMAKGHAEAGTCRNAAEWLAEPDDPDNPLITDLVEVGSMVAVVGPSKAAKSFLVLQIAVCIATGTDLFGRKVKRQRVYLANMEVSRKKYKKRLRKICARLGVEAASLDGWLFVDNLRGRKASWNWCHEAAELNRAEVVIVDPFYQVFEGKETDEGDCQKAVEEMKRFLAAGWTLFVVFHAPKGFSGDRQVVDMISGSSILARFPDNVVAILPHAREKNARVVDCSVLRDYAPPDPFSVKFDDGALVLAPEIAPKLAGQRFRQSKTPEEREAEKVERENKRADDMDAALLKFLKSRGADLPSHGELDYHLRKCGFTKHAREDFMKHKKADGAIVVQNELTRNAAGEPVTKSRNLGGRVFVSTPEFVQAYRREWGAGPED